MTPHADARPMNLVALCSLALFVGIVAGFGAVVFRALIAFIHNLLFLGQISFVYEANLFTPPSPWGPLVILVPIVGGMGVVFLVNNFAPEAKGHGVPEVMDAIFYKEGRIRPVVALVKSLASALSIGSGAAVGREGPIIQIGSSFGSTLGQILKMPPWQRITLVSAGAGAGIAATFNTPLGGVMFAAEIMMPEVSPRTFLPVVIATGAATYIGRLFFGIHPAFEVPPLQIADVRMIGAAALSSFVVLGVLCGLASWAFIRVLYWMETVFPKIPGNDYTRHAIGMALVGTMMYALMFFQGHYFIEGVGYATIQSILKENITAVVLLAVLFVGKLLATTLSLGSGSSGGIFSPSLFVGATLGGAFGALMDMALPAAGVGVGEAAMVGMAAVVGGATGGAMTAIVMIFEMTRDYNIMVPAILAVAASLGVRRVLSEENIYTIKLARRGKRLPKYRYANMYAVRFAHEVMNKDIVRFEAATPLTQVISELVGAPPATHVLVGHDKRVVGIVQWGGVLQSLEGVQTSKSLGDVARKDFVLVREHDILHDVMNRMSRHQAARAIVSRGRGVPRVDDIVGVISLEDIGDSVVDTHRQLAS
jgi:chloride channel protein, CIC family